MADSQFVTRTELKEELTLFKTELKAELGAELRAEWRADMAEMEERLSQRFQGGLDACEQRMIDTMRELLDDRETRLLNAFYGWAEGTGQHLRQIDVNEASLNTRVASLENRVFEVEKRLMNLPPTA